MKKFKKWLLCLLCTLSVAAIPQTVMAAEILEDPSAMITFQANVPDDFDEDIILKIRNIETDVTVTMILAESVDYARSTMILKNSPVEIEVIIEGDYITDLEDSYTFSDVETVDFTVSEDTGERQEPTGQENPEEPTDSEIPHGEETDVEIDELTGLESADSVWNRFVNICSVMDGNSDYENNYLWLYSAEIFKQEYLKDKETNTEEAWNEMTPTERYILHMSYTLPKTCLNGADNENDFVKEMESNLTKLENIEGGEVIRDAVEDLWRWHYKYYLHTGTFYDFYADYDEEYKGTPLDGSKDSDDGSQSDMEEIRQELSDSEREEIKEALEEENPHGEENENVVIAWIKRNVITLCILAIIGIALIVTTIVIKRKNLQDT